MKIGAEGKEVYVYRGDVANRALQLAGLECQMFVEKSETKHIYDFAQYSNAELVQILEQEAKQLLLDDQSGGDDNDGNGDPGA